ncbi:MAG: hypothetical protein AABZ06_04285 [Bdellovibrionota bacterium]
MARRSEQAKKSKNLEELLELPEVISWRALMSAFQAVFRQLEQGLLTENCSISRFQILLLLYFYSPMLAAEIARRLLVTRGNVSMFLHRLKVDGLARMRTRQPGKRAQIELTAKGTRLFESLFPRHIKRVKKLMPVLDPKFLSILQQISLHSLSSDTCGLPPDNAGSSKL